jgi:hypothetical protein
MSIITLTSNKKIYVNLSSRIDTKSEHQTAWDLLGGGGGGGGEEEV